MDPDQQLIVLLVGLYILWICGPLVPSILIYKVFPNSKVALQGPFSGLTINATGAFAAYMVVFVLAYPFTSFVHNAVGSQLKPMWTVKVSVIATDDQGQAIEYDNFYKNMTVVFSPKVFEQDFREVTFKLPGDSEGQSFPKAYLQIPGYGAAKIDLSQRSDLKDRISIDEFRKEIIIHGEIPIVRFKPIGSPGMVSLNSGSANLGNSTVGSAVGSGGVVNP